MNFDNHCFCELAPLYALDLLSESEKLWVEQQLLENPELANELAQYDMAIAAIPYSTPVVPMAADLKHRLFSRLELELPQPETDIVPDQVIVELNFDKLNVSPSITFPEIKWQPHPTPGAEIAIFHTDIVKREVVGLFRAIAGVYYPLHRHAAREELHLLAGDLVVGDRVYGAGECIVSEPGSTHAPYTTGGCMFFFRTSIDDEYLG
jgi:hypothetical protein